MKAEYHATVEREVEPDMTIERAYPFNAASPEAAKAYASGPLLEEVKEIFQTTPIARKFKFSRPIKLKKLERTVDITP